MEAEPSSGAGNTLNKTRPDERIYFSNRTRQYRIAGLSLIAAFAFSYWSLDNAKDGWFMAFAAGGCFLAALIAGFHGFLRYPRLKVTAERIELDRGYSRAWANWNSLGPFEINEHNAGKGIYIYAVANIVGREASLSGQFEIPDKFERPIADILADCPVTITADYRTR